MGSHERNPAGRRHQIQRRLLVDGSASVEELSRTLGVSLATVRRDLAALDGQGLVRRTHGGAVVEAPRGADQDFALRAQVDAAEKNAMAAAALALAEPDATILMNDGSTVMAVARAIAAARTRFTVVTPGVNTALLLAEVPGVTVYLLGGNLRHRTLGTSGSFAEAMLASFNADLALIAAEGFSVADGLTFSYETDATLARMMAERARTTAVLATARKLGQRDRITAMPASGVDALVTGCADAATLAGFTALGIRVVRAQDAGARDPSSVQALP